MILSKWFIAAFLFFAAGILCVWQGVKLMADERKRLKNLMDGEGIVKKALVMEKGRGETVVPADTVRYAVELTNPPRYVGYYAYSQKYLASEQLYQCGQHTKLKFRPSADNAFIDAVYLPENGIETRFSLVKGGLFILFGLCFIAFAALQLLYHFIN